MPTIRFVGHDGTEYVVQAEAGRSLMEIAVDHQVPGIMAACGGCCTCATCHAYVDPAWVDRFAPPSEDEEMMLEAVPGLRANSRLSCQLIVGEEHDGLLIRLPVEQI